MTPTQIEHHTAELLAALDELELAPARRIAVLLDSNARYFARRERERASRVNETVTA